MPRQQQLQPDQRGLLNCHLADYNGTTNPPHKAAGFPQDCSVCHTTTNWTGATFNHSTTGFALTGAHTDMQCAQCHVNNNLQPDQRGLLELPPDRLQRHHQPAHQAAGFPQDCSICHSTTYWSGATFTHPSTPLR